MKQSLTSNLRPKATVIASRAPSAIEPGLLFVFRLVLALQLALALVRLVTPIDFGAVGRPGGADRFSVKLPGVDGRPVFLQVDQDQRVLALLSLGWIILLLGYLAWPWLRRSLGRVYLPIALGAVTVFPLLERLITLWLWLPEQDPRLAAVIVNGSSWRLWMGVLLPLVLIAWQYRFGHVMGYMLGVALFDILLTGWMVGAPNWRDLVRDELDHVIIFTLIAYIVTLMMAGQRQQRQELAEANVQLAQHAETLEQLTISRERNRLARELHDTLAHTLSAVSVQLDAVDSVWDVQPEKARELLAKSLAQTRSGLTETRRALQALRASPLDDLGLALAVRNLAESTAKRGGLALQLAIEEVEPLAPEVEQQIYRIAQEALTNVFKHSQARTLRVALGKSKGQLTLTIDDDGQGFDIVAVQANGHYGLRGMRERAELIGATLDVALGAPRGTVVRLRVPEG